MIDRGAVSSGREAILPLRVRGPAGDERQVPFVVDTGFTGKLTLSMDIIEALNLSRRAAGRAFLADGSMRRFESFNAEIYWGGAWMGVIVSALGEVPLLGMGLLEGRGLWVEVFPGGAVEVRPLGPISS